MNSKFCPFCGIRTNNNSKASIISCSQCYAVVSIEVMSAPTKTYTEVHKEFVKTQLSEYQQFGSKKGRRRKK